MATLRDVPKVFRSIGFFTFLRRVWQQVNDDQLFTWAAALAYSWMFAIFPFLVFLLSLVPLVPDQFLPDVKAQVHQTIDKTLPQGSGSILKTQVDDVLDKPSAGGFLSFGLVLTIWAASGGMYWTMTALDRAYDIEHGRKFIAKRSIAMLLTLVVASMVIAVMVLMPIGTGVLAWLISQQKLFGPLIILIDVARYAIALLLLLLITAIIYHFGLSIRGKFHALTPGAAFSIIVWLTLGSAFKIYIVQLGGAASYNRTYGAVAGLVILLLIFYLDALVLLVGAEINSEIDFALANVPEGQTREQRMAAAAAARRARRSSTPAAG